MRDEWIADLNDMIRVNKIGNELLISFDEINAEALPSSARLAILVPWN